MGSKSNRSDRICPFTTRIGLILIGISDMILGLIGLAFLLLDSPERHQILQQFIANDKPIYLNEESSTIGYDELSESYQFLIEIWFPSLFLLILGTNITASAIMRSRKLALSSFILSTIFIACCLATVVSLLISSKIGALGFFYLCLIVALQTYFYIVNGIYWIEISSEKHSTDKEMLIINNYKENFH